MVKVWLPKEILAAAKGGIGITENIGQASIRAPLKSKTAHLLADGRSYRRQASWGHYA